VNWSLRTQLLRQSAIASAIILVITAMALHGLMRMSLYAEFDAALLVEAKSLASHVEQSGDEIKVEISLDTMPEFIRQDQPHYFQIWDAGGTTVAKSASLADVSTLPSPPHFGTTTFTPLKLPSQGRGRGVHFAFKPHYEDSEYVELSLSQTQETNSKPLLTLGVARPIQELDRTLAKLAWLLTFVTTVATCVTTLITNGVIKKGFKSLESVAQNIEMIGVNDLSGRIELQSVPSEVLPITKRINELMTRLESALNREKSFSADVAHELRTPLAGLETTLEVCASRDREPKAYQVTIGKCLEVTKGMHVMVNNLLTLARAESNTLSLQLEETNIREFLRECWSPFSSKAEHRGLKVLWDNQASGSLSLDREKLRLILGNLFDNATTYVDDGGMISIESEIRNEVISICIVNSGCILSQSDIPLMFERFWRSDKARSDAGIHSGLGLSLCQRICHVLNASILATVVGNTFAIKLQIPLPPQSLTAKLHFPSS